MIRTIVTNGVDVGYHLISSLFAPVYRSEVRLSAFSATTRLGRLGVDGDGHPFAERARLSSDPNLGTSEAAACAAPSSVVLVAGHADCPARLVVGLASCAQPSGSPGHTDSTADDVANRRLPVHLNIAISVLSPFHGVCLVTMMLRTMPCASSASIDNQSGVGPATVSHGSHSSLTVVTFTVVVVVEPPN